MPRRPCAMKTHLIVIDPQNDFCAPNRGALYVRGAEKDMEALAAFVRCQGDRLDAVHVTLDSHQSIHVAHPIFWQDPEGRAPAPFTTITRAEVESGRWTPANPAWRERGLAYVRALEQNRRYELMIWPPHCRIGTWGHGLNPALSDALLAWEERRFRGVNFVLKGSNPFTEHYSAVVADVPDDEDESTQLNRRFIDLVKTADRIFLSGEALSHCLANTVTDIAEYFGAENVKKFVLLRDTTSNVPGCEGLGERFIQQMAQRGMQVVNTGDVKR